MVILAGLATMIIPNMSSGTEAAKLTSMRNDARTAISTLQAKNIDEQDYTKVIGHGTVSLIDNNDDGLADTGLADGTKIQLSAGNRISVKSVDCNGGTGNAFYIAVENSQISDKAIYYDSCSNGKIQLSTNW